MTLIDFSEPGELGVFTDAQTVDALEKRMNERGYLEGSEMGNTFNMLRANDLIWSFVVNNYLLGKEPVPFDLLHWNADSTRMPACMHTFYLRNMYVRNALRKPGGITLGGVPIDVRKVKLLSSAGLSIRYCRFGAVKVAGSAVGNSCVAMFHPGCSSKVTRAGRDSNPRAHMSAAGMLM